MKTQKHPFRSRRDRRRAPRPLGFQPLEKRIVLDANSILSTSGALTIDAGLQSADVEVFSAFNRVFVGSRDSSGTMRYGHFDAAAVKQIVFRGSELADKFVNHTSIQDRIYGKGGNDTLTGGAGASFIDGGAGNDVLQGGDGNDVLQGNAGTDTLWGGDRADTLLGGSGNDVLHGDAGCDWLEGGAGSDLVYGGLDQDTYAFGADTQLGSDVLVDFDSLSKLDFSATKMNAVEVDLGRTDFQFVNAQLSVLLRGGTYHEVLGGSQDDRLTGSNATDVLRGGGGNDRLEGAGGNDWLFGDEGDDFLYGGAGNDWLTGCAGNDGLFGGDGVDYVGGSSGADRFLFQAGDILLDYVTEDALIMFANAPAQFVDLEGFGNVQFTAGTWTDQEILRIDVALANVHQHTGNARLLKQADGIHNMIFERAGNQVTVLPNGGQFPGWNSGSGTVTFSNLGLVGSTNLALWETVYHELGHNWDTPQKNQHIDAFRKLSDWRKSAVQPTANHLSSLAANDDWWYVNTALFARPDTQGSLNSYSRWNPFEDYATTWETYFLNRYHGTTNGNVIVKAKHANLDLLFAALA